MSNKKLHKRDRAWNTVKVSSKTIGKGFQKVKPIIKKAKYIVNPRNAMIGIFFTTLVAPSLGMAMEIPKVPPVEGLPGWSGNVSVTMLLALGSRKALTARLIGYLVLSGSTLI